MPLATAGAALIALLAGGGEVLADGGHGAASHAEAHDSVDFDAATDSKVRGVELGEYNVRAYYPVQAQKSSVRFVLYAIVPKERFQQIGEVVDRNRYKVQDQVTIATRMAPLAVFNEPGLESFRRRIVVRLRRAIPELEIEEVCVSDFQLAVQSL